MSQLSFSRHFLQKVKLYLSSPVKHLYKGSIFGVLNTQRFEYTVRKAQQNTQQQSYSQQIIKTIKFTLHNYINVTCTVICLNFILSKFIKNTSRSLEIKDYSFTFIVIILPIIEEIMHRGVFQRSLRLIPSLRISSRIVVAASLFATTHLFNSGGYLNKLEAIVQCLTILLYPTESIVYEKSGLLMSIVSHITNNLISILLIKSIA